MPGPFSAPPPSQGKGPGNEVVKTKYCTKYSWEKPIPQLKFEKFSSMLTVVHSFLSSRRTKILVKLKKYLFDRVNAWTIQETLFKIIIMFAFVFRGTDEIWSHFTGRLEGTKHNARAVQLFPTSVGNLDVIIARTMACWGNYLWRYLWRYLLGSQEELFRYLLFSFIIYDFQSRSVYRLRLFILS